jgi:zinc D-Ala-D-Ala carboxypeptidase
MNLWGKCTNALAGIANKYRLRLEVPFQFSWTGYSKPMRNPWRYFSLFEVEGLDTELVAKLDQARHTAGVPFIITSGKRSSSENERVMGVESSAHIKGKAVDLRSHSSGTHFAIVRGAILAGFTRVGIYHDDQNNPTHIHLDIDEEKPANVMWQGESH